MQSDSNSLAAEWASTVGNIATSRHEIRQWLQEIRLDPDRAHEVLLAVTEAITNAMEHGNRFDPAKTVSLQATLHGETLTVTVYDRGHWIDPSRQPLTLKQQRGRGMHLINELADTVDITGSDCATQITMGFDIAEQKTSPPDAPAQTDPPLLAGVPRDDSELHGVQPTPESTTPVLKVQPQALQ